MTDTWCIENDFAAQRELAVIEEARSFREIEKLRAQLAASEQRVKALEEALTESILQIEYLHGKFQETGSGNAVLSRLKSLEATCQK